MITMNHDHLQSIQYKPVVVQKIYHSNKRTLLVGEGDFSFASSLATQYGVANNIVATSLDSKEDLYKKYRMDAFKNINNLICRGAQVFHSVNVYNMATKHGRKICDFEKSFYDIINFNFHYAGFYGSETDPEMIRRHKELIQLFFTNAAFMLAPRSLIYVSHECGPPYDDWNLEEQAKPNGFVFLGATPFYSSNFPGYKHRRGDGSKAGKFFKLRKATTYIFEIRDNVWIDNIIKDPLKTGYLHDILLQISNLRAFKEGMIKSGRASPEDNLLQIIATEVTRLEAMTLGKGEQKQLNSLKLMFKVMHLAVKVPPVVARITSLQATSSWERRLQNCAARVLEEAFQEEQNTKLEKVGMGAPKEGEKCGTRQCEPCEEQCRFDARKIECPHRQQWALQREEASEIEVADSIAKEAGLESEGEEPSVCAAGRETRLLLQCRGQDGVEHEDIDGVRGRKRKERHHESTIEQVDTSLHLEHDGAKEGDGDRREGEDCGAHKTSRPDDMAYTLLSHDMEDAAHGIPWQYKHSLVARLCAWIREYRCGCSGPSTDCFGTKRS